MREERAGWRKTRKAARIAVTPPISIHLLVTGEGYGKEAGLVSESLTGFFPATGCAPHVPLLHAVYLSALLCLAAGFPW